MLCNDRSYGKVKQDKEEKKKDSLTTNIYLMFNPSPSKTIHEAMDLTRWCNSQMNITGSKTFIFRSVCWSCQGLVTVYMSKIYKPIVRILLT